MNGQKRIRDYHIHIGEMAAGERNSITDVPGVQVGHCTVAAGEVQSGVTAVLPADGNLFSSKVMAAVSVFNGFGKSMGLMQIEELGTIETPILLTNTLCVGGVTQALVHATLEENRAIENPIRTVNPLVLECNDYYLNDIQKCAIGSYHVREALGNLSVEFAEGSVGAGRGMSCYRLQGGIGSASRRMELDGRTCHLGSLVLTNMGLTKELLVDGKAIGKTIAERMAADNQPDCGSIIVILGCDIPLTERQLQRIANRAIVGISRTGSHLAHGSGEVAVAFSTQNRVAHVKQDNCSIASIQMLFEPDMDLLFRAAIESVEEAILNSMITAERVVGVSGHSRPLLKEFAALL